MSDADYGYVPQLPALRAPAAPSGVEGELRRLNRARFMTDPFSSVTHRIAEWSSRKALESTARRFEAEKTATDSCNAAMQSIGVLRETTLRLQVQREFGDLRHEFALQRATTQLHIEFERDRELLHTAQRGAITAQNGAEAAIKFKDSAYRLGLARKEAQIAETAELVEPASTDKHSDRTATIEELFKLRGELRVDGKDTTGIDNAINALGNRLGLEAK